MGVHSVASCELSKKGSCEALPSMDSSTAKLTSTQGGAYVLSVDGGGPFQRGAVADDDSMRLCPFALFTAWPLWIRGSQNG